MPTDVYPLASTLPAVSSRKKETSHKEYPPNFRTEIEVSSDPDIKPIKLQAEDMEWVLKIKSIEVKTNDKRWVFIMINTIPGEDGISHFDTYSWRDDTFYCGLTRIETNSENFKKMIYYLKIAASGNDKQFETHTLDNKLITLAKTKKIIENIIKVFNSIEARNKNTIDNATK